MIFNVVTSIQAEEDLRGIFEYIAFELLSPENAEKQLYRVLYSRYRRTGGNNSACHVQWTQH